MPDKHSPGIDHDKHSPGIDHDKHSPHTDCTHISFLLYHYGSAKNHIPNSVQFQIQSPKLPLHTLQRRLWGHHYSMQSVCEAQVSLELAVAQQTQ